MNFQNYTPFAAQTWECVNNKNQNSVVGLARVKYDLKRVDEYHCDLVLSKDQGELFDTDIYYDKVGESSVRYESDFVDYKAYTDVIVNANAICPIKQGSTMWECCVKIYDNEDKQIVNYPLLVKSEKLYHKAGIIWTPTLREKAFNVPIIYEKAYGGTIVQKDINEEDDEYIYYSKYNPVGCGVKKIKDPKEYINSVQISNLDEKPQKNPAGYGFIAKNWQNRLDFIAKYDEKWLEEQHPLPPKDFNYDYNQAANQKLILVDYAKAGYKFELQNLKINQKDFYFEIPELELITVVKTDLKDSYQSMNIDTIIVDINDEDKNKHCVYLSYRTMINIKDDVNESVIMINNKSEDS